MGKRPQKTINSKLQHGTVLIMAVNRIAEASTAGKGVYLTAKQIRALDWAVIREHSNENQAFSNWKHCSHSQAAYPDL